MIVVQIIKLPEIQGYRPGLLELLVGATMPAEADGDHFIVDAAEVVLAVRVSGCPRHAPVWAEALAANDANTLVVPRCCCQELSALVGS